MDWLAGALRRSPELALFLSLAIGYTIGKFRIGSFQVGAILGTLIAGLAVGQFVVPIPDAMKNVFFLMFMFAIGFRTGPEFFRSLRSNAVVQIVLVVVFCVTALIATWAVAKTFQLGRGTAAGLLAGAQTNSTALGASTSAAAGLSIDSAAKAQLTSEVAAAYAFTYVVGAILAIWFIPNIGPRLMGINLRESSREYERKSGATSADTLNSAFRELTVRAYRLPSALAGKTVGEVEGRWPAGQRVVIPRIRRAEEVLETSTTTQLCEGDVVAAAGRSSSFVADSNPLKEEVNDPGLLHVPAVTADLVLTNRDLAGRPLRSLVQHVSARGVFLVGIRRGGRELPFTASTIVERGDVLNVTGSRREVDRVADEIGYAVIPGVSTDLLIVAATIFVGGIIGLPALVVGGISLSLGASVGVLLAGLVLGHLRSINPRFGRIPDASVALLESMGLAAFVGCVGLQSGPGVLAAVRGSGGTLIIGGAIVTLLPPIVTILVGHYVTRFPPPILLGLCAGAGTSAPTLAALEKTAESKVPTLGYGLACAAGNVLMAVWGTLIVVLGN